MNLFEELKNINKENVKTILVYPRYTTVDDPYEKTKKENFLEAVPIKDAIVTEIGAGSLKWKYYGQIPGGSKQVICRKQYLTLLKVAGKIEIDGEFYGVWVDADKGFTIRITQDYLVCIMDKKVI